MYRNLLRIASRVGKPGTLLSVGHAEGAHLYLEVGMGPVSVVACLEREDVAQLVAACSGWLGERDTLERAEHYRATDQIPAPLVAGRIGAGLRDAVTVQHCTVPDGAQVADLRFPGGHFPDETGRAPLHSV